VLVSEMIIGATGAGESLGLMLAFAQGFGWILVIWYKIWRIYVLVTGNGCHHRHSPNGCRSLDSVKKKKHASNI
jgi:hypothetical protein